MKKVSLKFVDHQIGIDLWYSKKDLFNKKSADEIREILDRITLT